MGAARKLEVSRKPVSINLTCSRMCWKQVGRLVEFEMAQRGWTKSRTCEEAVHPVSDNWMSRSTLNKLINGDYARGGPFIATIQRVFLKAFKSSKYRMVLTSDGSTLER